MLDYGYSTLDRDDVNYESYAGTGRNGSGPADTLTFNFNPNGEYSIDGLIDYTNPANVLLTDPGGWGQVGFLRVPETNDELHQLRAEAYWEFDGASLIASLRAGSTPTVRRTSTTTASSCDPARVS